MPPRSRSLASSIQYSRLRLVADLSAGFCGYISWHTLERISQMKARSYLPLPRRQVPDSGHVKGIQQNLFLSIAIAIAFVGGHV